MKVGQASCLDEVTTYLFTFRLFYNLIFDIQTASNAGNTPDGFQDVFHELVTPGSAFPFLHIDSFICLTFQCPCVSAQASVMVKSASSYSFGNNLPSPSIPKCLAAFAASILSLISPSLILLKVLTSTSFSFPVFASNHSPFVLVVSPLMAS